MINVKIDGDELVITLDRMVDRTLDLQPAFEDFHTKMVARVDKTFELAGGAGSAVIGGRDPIRGLYWRAYSDLYKRKDGTVVPAWGGVQRKDGAGLVKGRLRASGRRITPNSLMNQDTGALRRQATTGTVQITPSSLMFGPKLSYAERVNKIRPFLVLTESDKREALISIYDYLLGDKE